ncbi:NAD(P)-dependent oxidoreductase [Dyadobacter sp. Leaf189]|uniref:NAD(P)-dependent oxidoreductase n=1 Tax=Dyadobacter sp. Leaf189 TaxID=1736295 RepID=UPI0006FA9A02|nr:NAD(P)H-binding protein [Dyadobacter sp. Leaf189]KQS24717.1 NADH-flavin reductase [Dyadobacter sp. Leaf189]
MNTIQHIAVTGGSGRTGRFLVEALLREGYHLKLLLRHPEQFPVQGPSITIIKGDVLDPQAVESLVAGCDAVMSATGQRKGEPLMPSQAAFHILNAIEAQPNRQIRYITLAGLSVDTPTDEKGSVTQQATNWVREKFPDVYADLQKAYSLLQQSQVDWVLVRVPFIEFEAATGSVKVDLADCSGTKIAAGDIAEFMVAQLKEEKYLRKAPFVAGG